MSKWSPKQKKLSKLHLRLNLLDKNSEKYRRVLLKIQTLKNTKANRNGKL